MFDDLIRNSIAPERVRSALDLLLSTGAPLPVVDEAGFRRFVRIAEHSHFAIDVLRSVEEAWTGLLEGTPPVAPPGDADPHRLRRFLALAHLQAIVLDLGYDRSIVDVMTCLSDAADCCIETALGIATRELAEAHGLPTGATDARSAGLAVLGMGKLGGRELNFSSDIDLIFVYREDGETVGGVRGVLAHETWYTRLVQRAVDLLSSRLISPFAYRVDLRLRPEGKSGPLVRSLDATLRYYEREGSAWERQAFLKARVVAGDRETGARLLSGLEPFVYQKYLDRDSIYQIEAIKARIEAQVTEHGSRHVKLSVGGIREIEFLVQILQLAHGGRCPEVRRASTLAAIEQLVRHGYLLDGDREILDEAYLFLRRLEHRIQILDARQTHLMPEDQAGLDDLAARTGFSSGEELWRRHLEITAGVRRFYDRRFARSKEIAVTEIEERVMEILDEDRDAAGGVAAARRLGFDEAAIRELRRMSRGSVLEPPTSALRLNFIRSTAVWAPILVALPAPTAGLNRLSRMIECYGAKSTVYGILASHPPVAELLVNIAALSEPLSERICRDPSALEALLAPGGVTGRRSRTELGSRLAALERAAPDPQRAALIIQSEERLRIGVRFLLGIAAAVEAGTELAALAEILLGEPDFAIIALGRFGLGDLGFGSDLDLVFVSRAPEAVAARQVQERLARWQELGLAIDARLRPMGRTGPVATTPEGLRDYFTLTAETWERIVWTRARVLHAPEEMRAAIETSIRDFVLRSPWDQARRDELRAMRARILAEVASRQDLKKGPGGMLDLDFTLAVRRIETGAESVEPESLLADQPDLLRSYRFLRALEASAWIAIGRPWRAALAEEDRCRIETVMKRHGFDPADLDAVRRTIREGTTWCEAGR